MPQAVHHRPGTTHEIMVFANDPQYSKEVEQGAIAPLRPFNLRIQFIAGDDGKAMKVAETLFQDCLEGDLNPEVHVPGAYDQWVSRVSSTLQRLG